MTQRDQINAQYLHRQARQLESFAIWYLVEKGDPKAAGHFAAMAITFTSRQISHLRSICTLIEAGRYYDALVIAKLMFEGSIMLDWAWIDRIKHRWTWYWFGAVHDRRFGQPEARNDALVHWTELQDKYPFKKFVWRPGVDKPALEGFWKSAWHPWSIADMLEHVVTEDEEENPDGSTSSGEYSANYALFRQIEHHLREWVSWGPRSMFYGIDPSSRRYRDQTQDTWDIACLALIAGCIALMDTIGHVPTIERIHPSDFSKHEEIETDVWSKARLMFIGGLQ